MRRSICVLLLTLVFLGAVFGQVFDEAERLRSGDLTLLSSDVEDVALAKLSDAELRLLRNMIFASHGHVFKSAELAEFFLQFDWYRPAVKVSEDQLTPEEQKLVHRIQAFEARNEQVPSAVTVDELVGLWHESPVMPDTWVDRFVIYPDGRMDFLKTYFPHQGDISEYLGTYQLRGNMLVFTVNEVVKGRAQPEPLETPWVFRFPVSEVTEVIFGPDFSRQMITIGSRDYYLYDDNPETIGVWSRKS